MNLSDKIERVTVEENCRNCESSQTELIYMYKYRDTIQSCPKCGHQEFYCTGMAREFRESDVNSK